MKTMPKIGLTLFPMVLVSVLCLFLGCEMEEVADFSDETEIEGVVGGLANAASQAEAEAAIRNLLNKAEMGTAFLGSDYETYEFSDEDIADLADMHLLYLDGEFESSLVNMFEAVMLVADYLSLPEMEFDAVIDVIEGQTANALIDPEEPENALLVAIAAENGRIPIIAPPYNEDTARSPVQTVLFGLWLHREFATLSGVSAAGGTTKLAPPEDKPKKTCEGKCFIRYLRLVDRCKRRLPPGPERNECLRKAKAELRECQKDCHDQGKSGG